MAFHNACQIVVDGPFFPGEVGGTVHVKPTKELLIRRERQGGKMYISKDALKSWCVKKGVNMREMINLLAAEDVLLSKAKTITLGAGTDYATTRVTCIEIEGYHSKLGNMFRPESKADVLPFAPRRDPNNDDSLGGVKDIPY
jgi:hypothetical protein